MKKLFLITTLILPLFSFAQYQLNGKVFDESNNTELVGANIYVDGAFNAAYSDKDGEFSLNRIMSEKVEIIASYIGYQTDTITIDLTKNEEIVIYLEPLSYQTEEVIISGTRVIGNAPATKIDVSKKELAKNNLGQDLPYLLQQTPSVVSTSDGGTGIGYTGIRIRGSDASRINVTINGVPLNDPESHGVFWVNMPDFASSLNSVQIQRGLGTSTNGAGAFGATINLETKTLNPNAYGEVSNSIGFLENNEEVENIQYNNRKHTVQFGSGLINNLFSFEGRLSNIQSEGYIDRATADLKSYFLSGAYYGKKTIVKAITFGGKEVTYQSWYGTPESRIKNNKEQMLIHSINNGLTDDQTQNLLNSGRSYNFYTYDNQVDNYNQDHYQLHLSHEVNSMLTANLSLHYTKGYGYFEEFKENEDLADYGLNNVTTQNDTITSTDLIRRRWLDNDFYGMTYSLLYNPNNRLKMTLGGGINNYEGDHFGEVIWAEFASNSFPRENYYVSGATKLDGNIYMKLNYLINKNLSLYYDFQYRRINYKTSGTDNDLRTFDISENFSFINPKIGLNYKVSESVSSYFFAGIGNREPNRSDYTDQPLNTPKKDANKAESMTNIETGLQYQSGNYSIAANLYYMYYQNQLVNTGQLNDVGSPLRQNVDRSYRRGIEVQGGVNITKNLSWNVNLTLSQNKIVVFDELLYDYTNGFEIIEKKQEDSDIALSPNIIASSELNFQPSEGVEIALLTRYIGEQYLDNTSNENSKLEAYLVNDLRLQAVIPQKIFKELKLQILVNNILSEEYSSNGYSYSYIFGERITENFYYPQALRNYMIGLNVKF